MEEMSDKSGVPVFIKLALCLLVLAYAVQLHSPLRLNTDSVVILRLTAKLTDGKPYLLNGSRPVYPIGVPFTYSLMERTGIASAFGFGFFNLLCLGVAVAATSVICIRLGLTARVAAGIVLISFSSFVLIKHSVIPLTDIPYLAISLTCCALLEIYLHVPSRTKFFVLSLAVICAAGAILAEGNCICDSLIQPQPL
jgi:hypothetical protein